LLEAYFLNENNYGKYRDEIGELLSQAKDEFGKNGTDFDRALTEELIVKYEGELR